MPAQPHWQPAVGVAAAWQPQVQVAPAHGAQRQWLSMALFMAWVLGSGMRHRSMAWAEFSAGAGRRTCTKGLTFAAMGPTPSRAAAGPMRRTRGGFGAGRVVFWNGGAAWMGHATGAADAHAHHAIQLTLALDAPFLIRAPLIRAPRASAQQDDWMRCHGALVPPDARHQFDGAGHPVAILFIEPETVPGRALLARLARDQITPLEAATAAALSAPLRQAVDAASLGTAARGVIDRLAAPVPGDRPVDPRITAAIDWMRARPATPMNLADAARSVHLSPGRFRHLFVAQTGTTFRAYLLWARVGAAVAAGMAGRSWTDAAQEAGFADSAHLARTCRRMIGIAPGMLAVDG